MLKIIRILPFCFSLLLLSHCTSEQDVVNHLETMQRFRNNFRLSIKALEDSMQSHVNYINICQGTLLERKRFVELFEPEHRLYMDSLFQVAMQLHQESDSIKATVQLQVKNWAATEVKVETWIARFKQQKMKAGMLLDSLKLAENQMIESTKKADDLREYVLAKSIKGKEACQEYDKNFRNARVLYGPRLTAEYNKLFDKGL